MEIKPYPKNAKKHPEKQLKQIAESVKEFGWQQPIVVDKEGVIIVGHGRWEAYKKYGLTEPPIQVADLTEEQAKAYRLTDNKLNESAWDMDLVLEDLKDLSLELVELTGFDSDLLLEDSDGLYTNKLDAPVYNPSKEKPNISDLLNQEKMEALMSEIEKADIPEDIKTFLKIASYRHVVFDYGKIADFYAHSDETIKNLMEKSALVIVDIDKAISNGFCDMSEKLEKQFKEEYGK